MLERFAKAEGFAGCALGAGLWAGFGLGAGAAAGVDTGDENPKPLKASDNPPNASDLGAD